MMCRNGLNLAVLVLLYIDGSSAAGSLTAVNFDVFRSMEWCWSNL